MPCLVTQACHPSYSGAEAGGSKIGGQPRQLTKILYQSKPGKGPGAVAE